MRSTAAVHGPRWSRRAADWAELAAPISMPAWKAVAEATAIGPGMRVLDVGCGSGEYCRLTATRGAHAAGIDAAEGMIELARRTAVDADLRVGAMEMLPWPRDEFDVVTGFNAFQFAADLNTALTEARRVTRPGGLIAICNWGRPERCELIPVMSSLRALQPPPPPSAERAEPALGDPGVLEDLAHAAGLCPLSAGDVAVPFEAPDRPTLERALMANGGGALAIELSGEQAARSALGDAAAPFQRPDGSYRFANSFRYVIVSA